MISTDFAPNEHFKDAVLSLRLLMQPWKWSKGNAIGKVKRRLKTLFFPGNPEIFLYLTGRSALYHVLKYLDLPKNAEILVQGFTCEAVILPILTNKLKPVYVDINPNDFSMDLTDLIKKCTPESRVLILQHSFGLTPLARKEILAFAKANKLFVIEDAAHGFDHMLFQKRIPTTVLLSFGRSKSVSSVFGGAIVTTDVSLIKYLDQIDKLLPKPSFGFLLNMAFYKPISVFIKSTYDIFLGKLIHAFMKHSYMIIPEITKKEKEGNFDLSLSKTYPNLAAQLLLEQLRTFNDVTEKRKECVKIYNKELAVDPPIPVQALIRYPYIVKNPDVIIQKLRKKNIYLGRWYDQIVGPNGISLKRMKYQKGSCPQAEKICEQIINLPTSISKKEALRIVEEIKKI